jgi:hypothetical protein
MVSGPPAPPPAPTLTATADTYLRAGAANQNQGYDTVLRVEQSGPNRTLVRIDQAGIAYAVGGRTLQSAKLRLYIVDNGNNWGASGRLVNVHRLNRSWTEQGATWNCPEDTDPVDSSKNCNAPLDWEMSQISQWPFAATPTAAALHSNNQTGWVEWDVTADVAAFLSGAAQNYGWIIRKDQEGQTGRVDYSSREGSFKPVLYISASQ